MPQPGLALGAPVLGCRRVGCWVGGKVGDVVSGTRVGDGLAAAARVGDGEVGGLVVGAVDVGVDVGVDIGVDVGGGSGRAGTARGWDVVQPATTSASRLTIAVRRSTDTTTGRPYVDAGDTPSWDAPQNGPIGLDRSGLPTRIWSNRRGKVVSPHLAS